MNNPYDPHNYDDFHAQEYGGFGDQDGKGGRGGPGGGMYGMGGPPHMGRGGRFGPGVGNMGPGPRGPRGGMGYEFMLLIVDFQPHKGTLNRGTPIVYFLSHGDVQSVRRGVYWFILPPNVK